ncbi:MAG: transposase, partial [Desulfovibrio sp.]|nr:transposase [Desulfovibrio sp.]
AAVNKCANRVALHHLAYYAVRGVHPALGSQMVCNAVKAVADAYKTFFANNPKKRREEWSLLAFKNGSVHYDARTYSMKGNLLSLFTLSGRIKVEMRIGDFQAKYLAQGKIKEAELIHKRNRWYFNLVLDLPDTAPNGGDGILGVDIGENNLAATSTGALFGGGQLRYERDKFLALRSRLQSNGSKSAKQLLAKVSGREARHVKHVNHEVSKAIVAEAVKNGFSTIAMEDLTNIRKHIKAGRKMRTRLHRWAFRQLQGFVAYKAEAAGIHVVYVDPAYTSQTCSVCGSRGNRTQHRFLCPSCGRLAHADLNAGQNIASLGRTAVRSTGAVSRPNVALPLMKRL